MRLRGRGFRGGGRAWPAAGTAGAGHDAAARPGRARLRPADRHRLRNIERPAVNPLADRRRRHRAATCTGRRFFSPARRTGFFFRLQRRDADDRRRDARRHGAGLRFSRRCADPVRRDRRRFELRAGLPGAADRPRDERAVGGPFSTGVSCRRWFAPSRPCSSARSGSAAPSACLRPPTSLSAWSKRRY